jgi:thioredoxin
MNSKWNARSRQKIGAQPTVVSMTLQNWEFVVRRRGLALVTFWTDWCIACTKFESAFDRAARRHTDVLFGTVNIEDEKELAAKLEVFNVPTLIVLKDGAICHKHPDTIGELELEELICQAREGKAGATGTIAAPGLSLPGHSLYGLQALARKERANSRQRRQLYGE